MAPQPESVDNAAITSVSTGSSGFFVSNIANKRASGIKGPKRLRGRIWSSN